MRYSDLFPGRMIENLLRTEDMRFLWSVHAKASEKLIKDRYIFKTVSGKRIENVLGRI